MNTPNLIMTLVSCVIFLAIVAWISFLKTRGEVDTKEGYFLAGRGLTGVFIAGSMLLTNLSAEQLIGLSGSAYGFNMTNMAWEVTAAVSTIVMALVFLPRYLSGAFATLPQFLSSRFDDDVRRLTVFLFMLGYGLITIPSILYAGSMAVLQFFDIPTLLNVSYSTALLITILAVGIIGSMYAVFGGLKAVAVSDTINGIGLLIIGVTVPILGFHALGEGSVLAGIDEVLSNHTEKLNAIGAKSDPSPFGTLFTGMIFANLFYWCTNQYVIQRTLGAKNLAEGQKGVLMTGFLKLLVPFIMMLPGIIAFHLYGGELKSIDLAYPELVKNVLPVYLSGFFLAVLLGAVFSSFNSLLNSAATLFVLDVYTPYKKDLVSDAQAVKVAKIASVVIAIVSFIIAPLLQYAPEGLFQVIRIFTGFYNIPVIAIVIVGLFFKRVPGFAAKVVIFFHVISYALLRFVIEVDLHFIHVYGILFVIEVLIMLCIGYLKPTTSSWRYQDQAQVDLTPWKYSIPVAISLFSCVLLLYVLFSPVGLVGGLSPIFWQVCLAILTVNCILCVISMKRWRKKFQHREGNILK